MEELVKIFENASHEMRTALFYLIENFREININYASKGIIDIEARTFVDKNSRNGLIFIDEKFKMEKTMIERYHFFEQIEFFKRYL